MRCKAATTLEDGRVIVTRMAAASAVTHRSVFASGAILLGVSSLEFLG
jgi:hypothetical protein